MDVTELKPHVFYAYMRWISLLYLYSPGVLVKTFLQPVNTTALLCTGLRPGGTSQGLGQQIFFLSLYSPLTPGAFPGHANQLMEIDVSRLHPLCLFQINPEVWNQLETL